MSKLDKILIIDGITGSEWWLSLFFLFKFLERIVKMTFAIVSKSYALGIVLINSYFLNYQSCSASPLIYHKCFSNLFSPSGKNLHPFSHIHPFLGSITLWIIDSIFFCRLLHGKIFLTIKSGNNSK